MNKYLLLRDNKQSGPYSAADLAKYGLKPYDLVWLEGKSAAWRYPSEIEELKPFAPVVEEQPFDRFYKKAETKTTEPLSKDHTSVKPAPIFLKEEAKLPVTEKPAEQPKETKINTPKKIHVSLPGNKSATVSSLNKDTEEVKHTALPAAERSNSSAQLVTDTPRNFSAPVQTAAMNTVPNFEATYSVANNRQKDAGTNSAAPNQPATVSKLLFRTVAAACLLLGGALIGLIINFNNQQKKFQQLNQLVQEIKHQDNGISSVKVKKEAAAEDLTETAGTAPEEKPVYKEDIEIPAETLATRNEKPKVNLPARVPADTQSTEPLPAPVVPVEETPVPKVEKISPELARKNLWQLVSVDNNKFKTGVFGGISNLELKVTNKSLYQLEQVEVEIRFIGPEKKIVNTQTVVFENVAPGEQVSLQVPKSSRGIQIDYSIKKINTKELGLAHAGM